MSIFRFHVAQAALGDTLQVPTIDGRIGTKIPEGTQTGTTFHARQGHSEYQQPAVAYDQYPA